MAIPASELVKITPRVLSGAAGALNFNGLFLTTSNQAQADTLLTFNSATEVANYFGYDSQHHKAATIYFNGYDNSLTKPSQCFFFKHPDEDCPAFVRGQPATDEAKLFQNLIKGTNATLYLDMGGLSLELNNFNLEKAKSLSDIAQILQDKINDTGETKGCAEWQKATVAYSSLNKAFQINAGVASPEIAFNEVSGSMADLLGLSEATNAIYSKAVKARTYRETLDKARNQTGNFVTLTTIEEVTNLSDAQSIAEWVNNCYNNAEQFLYCFFTTDSSLDSTNAAIQSSMVGYGRVGSAQIANAQSGRDIVDLFLEKRYEGVCGIYGGVEYAAFIMGITASLDWNQPNSVITYAFKSQAGLSANVHDISTARELESLKLNFIGDYACRNDNFVLSANGMVFGSFNWIDSYINSCWLLNSLQTAILQGFKNSPKVPYNSTGFTVMQAWCTGTILKAKNNGVISTGVQLDDAQKITLERESNSTEICNNLTANGYHLQISATPDIRSNRASPTAQMWYTDSGAVHKFEMPVTTVQ